MRIVRILFRMALWRRRMEMCIGSWGFTKQTNNNTCAVWPFCTCGSHILVIAICIHGLAPKYSKKNIYNQHAKTRTSDKIHYFIIKIYFNTIHLIIFMAFVNFQTILLHFFSSQFYFLHHIMCAFFCARERIAPQNGSCNAQRFITRK